MDILFQLSNIDLALGVICVLSIVLFFFAGLDILFKFYFGVIIGFLLFLYFNSEIALIQYIQEEKVLSSWQNFLFKNSSFVLSFFSLMIPIFGIFFSSSESIHFRVTKQLIQICIFAFLLPLFLFAMFIYIAKNISKPLTFFSDVLTFLDTSILKTFFESHPQIVFAFLLLVLFYKMIFGFLYALFTALFNALNDHFGKGESSPIGITDEEEEEHHDAPHQDEHHHGHSGHH